MHRRFAIGTDRRGNISMMFAVLLLPMVVGLGAAIDIAVYEVNRVRLQNSLDRGVLAVASFDHEGDTAAVLDEYVRTNSELSGIQLLIDEVDTPALRSVSATASYVMPTAFLSIIGRDTLGIEVSASAEERRRNLEISLILDLSGSMRYSLSGSSGYSYRLQALKPAAKRFVSQMLKGDNKDFTSINLVPYAGHVSVGAPMFSFLGGKRLHNHSSCFEFTASQYGGGVINFPQRPQVPHFTQWNKAYPDKTWPNLNPGWCPSDDTAMSYLSNNEAFLHQRIDGYEMYDGTGSGIAMNWGLILLDPAMQPVLKSASNSGVFATAFKDRPKAFDDRETMKFIVLMTDGAISAQYRPDDPNRNIKAEPKNYTLESESVTESRLNFVCGQARNKGVTVFTISFNVEKNEHKNQMRNCATSPSHYYDVEDSDIESAFDSIATAIQKIKLTS